MSVKFEKETVRNAPIPGGKETDVAHKLGEKLTGGKSQTGYLAVSVVRGSVAQPILTATFSLGISQTATNESTSHQDAHFGLSCGFTGSSCIVDRERYLQAWALLHFKSTENGSLWCLHQCAAGTRLD